MIWLNLMVHGLVYALGSFNRDFHFHVPEIDTPESLRRLGAASVIGSPPVSSQMPSRNPVVVTTNVSPSHFPVSSHSRKASDRRATAAHR